MFRALILLAALLLASCLGTGYRGTSAETWVHSDIDRHRDLRYAVLPVDCPDEVIPSDAYGPWRNKRRLELTLHLQRELIERLAARGHTLTQVGLVEAAVGRGEIEAPRSVRLLDRPARLELARRIQADAVVETRVLDGSPERLTVAMRAVLLDTGELIWSSNRTA